MEKQNIHISGSGTVTAGVYGEIHISGSGTILGEVTCASAHISGSCRTKGNMTVETEAKVSGGLSAEGDVRADVLRVSGSAKIQGSAEAREARVSGGCTIGGDLQTEEGGFSGSLRVDGAVRGGRIRVGGSFRAGKGVECEELHTSGAFETDGLVNAEQIQIVLGGECRLDEVGCEEISVRRGENGMLSELFSGFTGRSRHRLRANLIEATRAYLEYTDCEIVRGQQVEIGPGCRVGRVEYTDSLEVSPEAEVGEQVRAGA